MVNFSGTKRGPYTYISGLQCNNIDVEPFWARNQISHCARHFRRRGEKHNKVTIQLRTTAPNGLLLWSAGRGARSHVGDLDFIAVAVVDGFPELSFKLGKDQAVTAIRAKASLALLTLDHVTRWEGKQLKGCVFSPPSLAPVPGTRKRNLSIGSLPTALHK